eukprot:11548737-Alexandrium_andersonii.AAC.1
MSSGRWATLQKQVAEISALRRAEGRWHACKSVLVRLMPCQERKLATCCFLLRATVAYCAARRGQEASCE